MVVNSQSNVSNTTNSQMRSGAESAAEGLQPQCAKTRVEAHIKGNDVADGAWSQSSAGGTCARFRDSPQTDQDRQEAEHRLRRSFDVIVQYMMTLEAPLGSIPVPTRRGW